MTGVYPTSVPNAISTGLTVVETHLDSHADQMDQRVGGVNKSVILLAGCLDTHSSAMEETLDDVKKSVDDLQNRVAAFESHPPTIGEVGIGSLHNPACATFYG